MSGHDPAREVLRLHALKKNYNVGNPTGVKLLHGLDLRLRGRDFVALVGASGSGKSTQPDVTGLLDKTTSGELCCWKSPPAAWATPGGRR